MNETFEGQIRTTTRKTGYIKIKETDESVEFTQDGLGLALDRDKVVYELVGRNPDGAKQGRVVSIVKRNKDVFVGQMKEVADKETGKREVRFVPDQKTFWPTPSIVNIQKFKDLEGKKILIKLGEWTNPALNPEFTVMDVLGKVGANETEMKAAVLDRGLMIGFPKEVDEYANEIRKNAAKIFADEIPKRRDMRDRLTFTIDPADAKDFDDALSFKKLDNGRWEVGVHIADPSFFVVPGTVLDDEAVKRATSIYLVDRTVPMLPEVLSNELCSLNPGEEKLTYSGVFEMDIDGVVYDRWFGRTLTVSDRRFNYEEAQEILDTANGDHYEDLLVMSKMAKKMQERKVANGAVEFESVEVKFKLDENLFPVSVYEKKRTWTMEMIEMFMLLANQEVSKLISLDVEGNETGKPWIYRIHEKPKPEKILAAATLLNTLGFEVDVDEDGIITSKEINRILAEYKGNELESFISMTMLRAMNKAVYSTKNIGHYGLNFKYYTHFTSPIRRYPDLIAHRYLTRYLAGEEVPSTEKGIIQELAEHSSEMEQRAVEAERASTKFKFAELYSTKIGEEVKGMIVGVGKFGVFVEDTTTKAEGMVNVRNMGSDFFAFDEKTMTIKGRKGGKTYKIGDKVIVKVLSVDIEERKIDFGFVA